MNVSAACSCCWCGVNFCSMTKPRGPWVAATTTGVVCFRHLHYHRWRLRTMTQRPSPPPLLSTPVGRPSGGETGRETAESAVGPLCVSQPERATRWRRNKGVHEVQLSWQNKDQFPKRHMKKQQNHIITDKPFIAATKRILAEKRCSCFLFSQFRENRTSVLVYTAVTDLWLEPTCQYKQIYSQSCECAAQVCFLHHHPKFI